MHWNWETSSFDERELLDWSRAVLNHRLLPQTQSNSDSGSSGPLHIGAVAKWEKEEAVPTDQRRRHCAEREALSKGGRTETESANVSASASATESWNGSGSGSGKEI